MKMKTILDFKRQINKPEYWFNPGQILKRIQYKNNGNTNFEVIFGPSNRIFTLNENEVIGKSLLTQGVYDLIVAETMRRLLKKDDFFVDVGANIGYFSRWAAEWGARSLSFEPHPHIFKKLQSNLAPFPLSEIHPFALSAEAGRFDLFIPKDFEKNEGVASLEPMDNADRIQVKTQRLDTLVSEPVKVIKIDVEGHEHHVLRGASQLLQNKLIENVIFEDFKGPDSEPKNILRSFGYEVFGLLKTPLGPRLLLKEEFDRQPIYEPPNFIATKNPTELKALMLKRGWAFYKN